MGATTYAAEHIAIFARLEANWTETAIAFPNAQYQPNGEPYIEPRVLHQEAFNASVDANTKLVRHPGLLTINVRASGNAGEEEALGWADTLVALFRNVAVSGCHFRVPTLRILGKEGSYYRVQVDCPYQRDSIH